MVSNGWFDEESGLVIPYFCGGDDNTGTDVVEEGEQVGSEQDSDRGDPASSGDTRRIPPGHVPYDRFKQVNGEYTKLKPIFEKYAKFGTPEQIEAELTRLKAISNGKTTTPDDDKRIREDLLRYLPELHEYNQFVEARRTTFIREGEQRVNKYLKEASIEVNDNNNQDLQEILAGRIARDKEMLKRYVANDPTVFDDAWKDVKTRMFARPRVVPGADIQSRKVTPTPGKAAPKPATPEKEKTNREVLDDAHEAAWARLQDE